MMKRSFRFYWISVSDDFYSNYMMLFMQYYNDHAHEDRSIALAMASLRHGDMNSMYGDWPAMGEFMDENEVDIMYDTELL